MSNFNWLQFSDLHLNQHSAFDTQMTRSALLSRLKAEKFKCDYVFITGDIAYKGIYDSAKQWIQDMLKCIDGAPIVFWAVGNHDIPREQGERSELIQKIRSPRSSKDYLSFESVMQDSANRGKMTHYGSMSEYILQYDRIFDCRLSLKDIDDAHIFYSDDNLNLVVLNTCLTSKDDEDEHRLYIAEQRLYNIFNNAEKNEEKPFFVIGHHGRAFFDSNEQPKLMNLFKQAGVDCYFCGHAHRTGYSRFNDAGCDIHQITCGGNVLDGDSAFTFIHGAYDSTMKTVRLIPYTFTDRFNNEWNIDDTIGGLSTKEPPLVLGRLSAKNVHFETDCLKSRTDVLHESIDTRPQLTTNLKGFERLETPHELMKYLEDKPRVPDRKGEFYYHYTNLNAAISMIRSGYLWLSPIARSNDMLEYDYGNKGLWESIYSFSMMAYDTENIGMWSMYAQPWKDGVRISIPKQDVYRWIYEDEGIIYSVNNNGRRSEDYKPIITDVLPRVNGKRLYRLISVAYSDYRSIKAQSGQNHKCGTQSNTTIKLTPIGDEEYLGELTGYIKDLAWEYEQEVRIFADVRFTNKQESKIAIRIPNYIIDKLIITAGPLLKDLRISLREVINDTLEEDILRNRLREVINDTSGKRLNNSMFSGLLTIKSPCNTCQLTQ